MPNRQIGRDNSLLTYEQRYKQLNDEIDAHPGGVRQMELSKKLRMEYSTVFYRVRELERLGRCRVQRVQGYVMVFPVAQPEPAQREQQAPKAGEP
jgi:hypothetical protein